MPVSCSDLPACGTLLNPSCAIRSSPGLTMRPLARFRSPKVRVKCKSWGLSQDLVDMVRYGGLGVEGMGSATVCTE